MKKAKQEQEEQEARLWRAARADQPAPLDVEALASGCLQALRESDCPAMPANPLEEMAAAWSSGWLTLGLAGCGVSACVLAVLWLQWHGQAAESGSWVSQLLVMGGALS